MVDLNGVTDTIQLYCTGSRDSLVIFVKHGSTRHSLASTGYMYTIRIQLTGTHIWKLVYCGGMLIHSNKRYGTVSVTHARRPPPHPGVTVTHGPDRLVVVYVYFVHVQTFDA